MLYSAQVKIGKKLVEKVLAKNFGSGMINTKESILMSRNGFTSLDMHTQTWSGQTHVQSQSYLRIAAFKGIALPRPESKNETPMGGFRGPI